LFASGLAKWNETTESWSTMPGPIAYGYVLSHLAIDANGDLVASGSGGVWAWSEATGAWRNLDFPAPDPHLELTASIPDPSGGLLMVFGGPEIWKWDGNSWTIVSRGPECVVSLAMKEPQLFAGGCFRSVGEVGALRLARLDLLSGAWSVVDDGSGQGVGPSVFTAAVGEDCAYIGGEFLSAGGMAANRVAAWDGLAWRTLRNGITDPQGEVWSILVVGDDVYVGGRFLEVDGMAAGNIARWNEVSSSWDVLNGGVAGSASSAVWDLDLWGEEILVSGEFTSAGGAPAHSAAIWSPASRTWRPLGAAPDDGVAGVVYQAEPLEERVYLGGRFGRLGDLDDARIHTMGYWDRVTGVWSYLRNGQGDDVDGEIWKLLRRGTKLYVGGIFGKAGDVSVKGIATLNLMNHSWTALSNWQLTGTPWVMDMTWLGPDLVVVGSFEDRQDEYLKGILRWNLRDGTRPVDGGITSFNGQASVYAVEPFRGGLLVAGTFTQTGDVAALNIGTWSRTSGSPVADVGEITLRSWPNPMKDRATIVFRLDHSGSARLDVLTVAGRRVATLLDGSLPAGLHTVHWNGTAGSRRLPAGVYFYRLETSTGTEARRLIVTG
jgi:hypothetical protein